MYRSDFVFRPGDISPRILARFYMFCIMGCSREETGLPRNIHFLALYNENNRV